MKKILLLIVILGLKASSLFAFCYPEVSDTAAAKNIAGQIVWKFQTNGAITSSPVYSDGIIYTGCGSSLLAVDTSGKELYRFRTQGSVKCTPALDEYSVYFQSCDGWLYCLGKKSGTEKWKVQLDKNNYLQLYDYWDYYHSSPLIVNGVLYIGSSNTCFYAIETQTGKELWKYPTKHIIRSSPVFKDGRIYFGGFDGRFYVLDAETGKEVWNYKVEKPNYSRCGEIQSSAVIWGGKVLFGSRDGNLHALDERTGKELWSYSHEGSWVISTPAVYDNLVITGSSDAHFVNANDLNTGKEVWRYNTKFNVFSSPVIYSGVVYCGEGNAYSFSEEASFFALDARTGREIWKIKTNGQVWSSPLVVNGRIYFGAMDGCIYAIK